MYHSWDNPCKPSSHLKAPILMDLTRQLCYYVGVTDRWLLEVCLMNCHKQQHSSFYPTTLNCIIKTIFTLRFNYPRPVMAFGYCRCLRLSVCVCVCVCVCVSVNHQFVRTITCHPLKLQSPNLDQKCKRPWLRSLLFLGFIDLDLQGQIELKSQNLPHFGLESLSGQ